MTTLNKPTRETRPRITLERSYEASLDEIWELWTTKDGIESWWGPVGFSVTVRKLDLRPGGELVYAMTAVEPPQIAFMKQANMPLTQECTITFREVVPLHKLAYVTLADFVPGIDPYEVETVVELQQAGGTVRMVLTHDAMHSEEWTQRAVMGLEMELDKLAKLLAGRRAQRTSA